ncbi:hypothetical protein H6785_00745 [Candidatus Nomurabacteria bacterium]|nr:hypothetical protein [Candidatus Kaiserbacteria bacterium]MCB9815100.1 hypothetical protein [Candidatus Nomurabacteria bacterium]
MSPEKSKVIVELYGLPGVGKTTFSEKLKEEYNFEIIPHDQNKFKLFPLTIKYPFVVYSWFLLIFKNYQKNKNWKIFKYDLSIFFSSLKKIDDAKKSTQKYVVVDEGLVQRFLSYSADVHSEQTIKKLLTMGPVGSALVHVDHIEVLKNRYNPDHVRMESGKDMFESWKTNMHDNLSRVVGVVKSSNVDYLKTSDLDIQSILINK